MPRILATVLLAIGYYLLFVPVALICRLWHRPMALSFDRRAASYWQAVTGSGRR
jgi:hypothetical protein